MLQGVRVLKYYAWEQFFVQQITDIRELEVSVLFDTHPIITHCNQFNKIMFIRHHIAAVPTKLPDVLNFLFQIFNLSHFWIFFNFFIKKIPIICVKRAHEHHRQRRPLHLWDDFVS